MACFSRFPRFRFHRTKNTFNPAEDGNTDTILSNEDSPVQIGRYIRREETPDTYTPKTSERAKQQKHLQSHRAQENQPNEGTNHTNTIATDNINNKNTKNNKNNNQNDNSNSNSNSNNNVNKKFISNKNKTTTNTTNTTNTTSNNKNTNSNHIYSSNSNHHSATHPKLKPVKERRPTALPHDIPKLKGDVLDGTYTEIAANQQINGANGPSRASESPSSSPTTAPNVKFFIGANHHPQHDDDTISAPDDPDTAGAAPHTIHADPESPSTSTGTGTGSGTVTAKTIPQSTSATASVNSHTFMPKSKHASSSSSKARRGQLPTWITQQQLQDDLNIPTPPPLPPQPLTTASSSTSLVSNRSAKTKSSSHSKKKSGASLYRECTLSEVLNISYSSTIAAGSSLNGRDSGVQVEDQSLTPKGSDGSDSPKSHRIQGGLIFTRTNLPVQQHVEIEFIKKDDSVRNLIRAAIEKNDFLNNYMDKERKEMVIDAMGPDFYEKGSYIIRENDEGSEIYVSEEGCFDVLKSDKVIGTFGPGTVFGELAILYNAKRFASIKAATNAHVWKIDREKFRNIMIISGSREREENLNFLRSAPFLNDLAEDVLHRVVDLLQRKFYETNTCIVREGEVGNEFFIIRGGTVTIKKQFDDGERIVDRRKRGDYFGEQALLNVDRRQASVYADAPGTEVLKLDREAFISYLGTIPQLREKPGEREAEIGRDSNRKSEFDNEYAHIELDELKKIATLGAGAFGRVDLVAYKNKTFALKIIKKIDILKQDQIEHVYSEKHVMMKCSSSAFIIELYKTFRNEKFVYFLMEACMGGDVWTIMSQRRFFDEKTAKFIAGCVVEAFDFLHSHNIIYRDLKPENLMLSTDGYCKLVDFGFAKQIPHNQKTNTFAGTPEYVAPEIILDRGHDRSVDYWALGILIFELLVGKTPFRGQNQIKIYQQILGGIDVIQMPSKIPKSAQGLIKHLCKQLPAERLGYQRRGILDIKRHSWFDSLDWNKLKNKQMPSPIKRPIQSNTDIQYFGPPGVENDHDPPDETSGWDIDF